MKPIEIIYRIRSIAAVLRGRTVLQNVRIEAENNLIDIVSDRPVHLFGDVILCDCTYKKGKIREGDKRPYMMPVDQEWFDWR